MTRGFVLLALSTAVWGETPRNLAVLCYHQIHPKASTEMVTTPQRFREQMDYLQKSGYRCVSLAQAERFLRGKLPAKEVAKPLLLTFDDGYEGVWRYAYPELKRRKMKGLVFMVVSQVGNSKPTPHLSWKQIEEMSQSGTFEFGSHTYAAHVPIPEYWAAGRLSRFALAKDLVRSRQELQKHVGHPVRSLAWPYGHYTAETNKVAGEAGFRLIFSTDYGFNLPASGCTAIRRIRASSVYDTVDVLRQKLATGG
jgi:peptidoglycan/xylan/chitin deacetylase (PgdA/CDA1 family)